MEQGIGPIAGLALHLAYFGKLLVFIKNSKTCSS